MTLPKLAAQLYTVHEHTKTASDLAATLKKVRAIGYQAVQVSTIGPIPDAEVKAMLDDNGLTCCITHDPEPWPGRTSTPSSRDTDCGTAAMPRSAGCRWTIARARRAIGAWCAKPTTSAKSCTRRG